MLSQRIEVESSFRDIDSKVWSDGQTIFRDIMPSYFTAYGRLMRSGLYEELVAAGLLVPHLELGRNNGVLTIVPRKVSFISYPYEWSFSSLQEAADVTLEINRIALRYGMILKDASAFNIQYIDGRWKLIDTTSFGIYEEGTPWRAFGQFARHFLLPLVLAHYRRPAYLKSLMWHIDGLPVLETIKELPIRSRFSLGCALFVHAFGLFKDGKKERRLSKAYLGRFLGQLQEYVNGLKPARETVWSEYDPDMDYVTLKKKIVWQALAEGTVGDLGANTGEFSRLALTAGREVVAIDRDHGCVEKMCNTGVLPLVVDLANPTPAIGWGNKERLSFLDRAKFDTVLFLAMVHHLCIGNNVPLMKVAEQLRNMTRGRLIVEFIPLEDEKAQLLSKDRVFPPYSETIFEEAFGRYFTLEHKTKLGSSCRELYVYSTR